MLSDELANLSDWAITHAKSNEPMPAKTCATFAQVLLLLSRQARAIEQQPVPLRARLPVRTTKRAAVPAPQAVAR